MRLRWTLILVLLTLSASAQARQSPQPAQTPPAQTAPAPQTPEDALGRDSPRGTVMRFLNAARQDEYELARQYLDTRQPPSAAETLARQLFHVLDARLPARLEQISDRPEGSRANPLTPDQEQIGEVEYNGGTLPVILDRVTRPGNVRVWLFSTGTLAAVPALYAEVTTSQSIGGFPRILTGTRVGGVLLFDWLVVLFGVPLFYLTIVGVNRLLTPLARPLWRRVFTDIAPANRSLLPAPVRLLILALAGRWVISSLPLSLIVRQVWANIASLLAIAAMAWLLIRFNGEIEAYLLRRVPRANSAAAASLLRLIRRATDVLIVFAGLIATLRHFRIDPTPALAGLGVGGIAIALAAQKTLENVIAGASLIFDQAVRVGDFLKMGEVAGTVDYIGLRSTRIRTLERTIVSVPNSQVANASIETFSARDRFWFHPVVGLRYETTPEQLRAVVTGIKEMLDELPEVDRASARVTFVKLGAFSLDVEVNAYLFARDWVHFLTLQEGLLFGVTDIVARAGTEIAFPSQTMYVSAASSETPHPSPLPASGARGPETPLPFEGRGQGEEAGSEGATVAGEARSFLRARGAD
jgi:MscS family membrane protein